MNCVIVKSQERPSRKMDKKELFVFNMRLNKLPVHVFWQTVVRILANMDRKKKASYFIIILFFYKTFAKTPMFFCCCFLLDRYMLSN